MFLLIKRILAGDGQTLTQRVMHSLSWVVIFQIISQLLNFTKSIVLARLLLPADFGLVGLAFLSIALVEVFSSTGFFQALIQKKTDIEGYLDTTWSISIIRGFFLTTLLFFAAPYIADFFNEDRAIAVIRVLAFTIFLNEFTNIGIVYFIKDLEYKKNYKIHLISDVIAFIVSVVLAYELKNVWALVYGQLTNKFFNVLLSFFYHPYRPKFRINLSKARELFRFGKFLTLSSILSYFIQQGDKGVIGRILDAASLGYYNLAYRFSNIISEPLNNIIISIAFPAYSKIQNDFVKVKEYYLKTVKFTSIINIPVFTGTFLLAEEFTLLLVGAKWLPAVPVIRILAALGIISTLNALNNSICLSLGKPKISTYGLIVQLVLFFVLVIPFTLWMGLTGTAMALIISNIVYYLITAYPLLNILNFRFSEIFLVLAPAVSGSIIMGIIIYTLKAFIINDILVLSLSVFSGILSYFALIFLIDKIFKYDIMLDFKTIMNKSRKVPLAAK